MNKFVRTILIISGTLVGIGIICVIIAAVMGVTVRDLDAPVKGQIIEHIEEDVEMKLDISTKDGIKVTFEHDKHDANHNEDLAKVTSYGKVKDLTIESGAGKVEILYGDVEEVTLQYDDGATVHSEVDEGELEIECGFRDSEGLYIILPQGYQLHDVDLDFGAGQIIMHDISFVKLDADIGAGQLIVNAPGAKTDYNYEIDYGIGVVVIGDEQYAGIGSTRKNHGTQKSMDIDCGAGSVEVHFAEE